MLQSDDSLPDVPMKPAPWRLHGQGWLVAMKLPAHSPARNAFMAPELAGKGRGRYAVLMFVDYAHSDCGPYHELLLVPGAFPFADGRRHLSISRILVSTWDSVVNGRENWGIPKDRAEFDVRYNVDGRGEDHIRIRSDDGREIGELRLRARWPLALPVHGGIVPATLRTLAQRFRGKTFLYAPASRGWIRPGRLVSWRFNRELFPEITDARVIAAIKIPSFHMTFPVARILHGS